MLFAGLSGEQAVFRRACRMRSLKSNEHPRMCLTGHCSLRSCQDFVDHDQPARAPDAQDRHPRLALAAVPDEDEGCPEGRVAAIGHGIWPLSKIANGGLEAGGGGTPATGEQCGHQIGSGGRIHAPVRNQQSAGAGLLKRLCQPGQRRAGDAVLAAGGVAARQDDEVGIE